MAAAVDTSDKSSMPKSNDATDSARIGWAFLSQYYSYLNKDPARLHCFYTKRSTLIHSTEGEDAIPCYGQQEIHAKIMSLAFEDCKVYISNVDSQSSAEGGIIVQVIGEMSNASGPWRKFAQTFFLAEQPNGYFVLNDICRYIKEEGDDDVVAAAAPAAAPAQPEPTAASAADVPPASVESVLFNDVAAPTPSYPAPQEEQQPIVSNAAAADPSSFTFHTDDAILHPITNGVAHPEPEAPKVEAAAEPEPAPVAEQPAAPEPAAPEPVASSQEETPAPEAPAHVDTTAPTVPSPVPAAEPTQPAPAEAPQPSTSTTAPAPAPAPAPVAVPTPAAPSAPAAPAPAPGPKSWASLAASNSTKWGSVSNASKGVSSAAPPAAEPTPAPVAAAAAPAPTAAAAASTSAAPAQPPVQFSESVLAVTQPACFVKGVVEWVPEATLRHVLTTRFGPLKEVDIVRSKACAFIEFETLHSARRAIQASLRPSEGGDGAILFDVPTGEKARINVVERKPHSERPTPRPRGGGSVGGQQGRGQGEGKAARGDEGARGGRGGASGARGGRGGRGGAKAGSGAPAASK
ncbi:hypothetical protein JCM1840_006645 [Sporobolomyces johnsonii]